MTAPIIEARSIKQLEDNLKSAELELTAEELAKLGEASRLQDLGYPYEFMQNIQGRW